MQKLDTATPEQQPEIPVGQLLQAPLRRAASTWDTHRFVLNRTVIFSLLVGASIAYTVVNFPDMWAAQLTTPLSTSPKPGRIEPWSIYVSLALMAPVIRFFIELILRWEEDARFKNSDLDEVAASYYTDCRIAGEIMLPLLLGEFACHALLT